MRVLVLGGAGMLGHKVWEALRHRFDTSVTLRSSLAEYSRLGLFEPEHTLTGVDVMRWESVQEAYERARPDVVINCIGIVKQLPAAKDPIASVTVNTLHPHRLAALCASCSRLVHISTDCVFSGRRGGYTEHDRPDPDDLYGRTKLLGEPHEYAETALTLRTSIIGRELRSTTGLTEWLLSQRGRTVQGYTGAVFTGLTTRALSTILAELVERHPGLTGLYHVSSPPVTKYDLLVRLNEAFQANVRIEPSAGMCVVRSLDSTRFWKTTGLEQPGWEAMIADMAADPAPYDAWRRTYVS